MHASRSRSAACPYAREQRKHTYRDEVVEPCLKEGRADHDQDLVGRHVTAHVDLDEVIKVARVVVLQPAPIVLTLLQPAAAPAAHGRDDNVHVAHAFWHRGGDVGKDAVH
eukprot:3397524-Pleurochrysis_carterae.AAC.2